MATAPISKSSSANDRGVHLSRTAKKPALNKRNESKGARLRAVSKNGSKTQIASQPGRFGPWGGRYVPETLMAALEELEREYERAKRDPRFKARFNELLKTYAGRPTPLSFAQRLTQKLGGARVYLKREDLLHTGAHKINNSLGQALLASTASQLPRYARCSD
jgi:hypothetical protein